jgi:hypothetical protein
MEASARGQASYRLPYAPVCMLPSHLRRDLSLLLPIDRQHAVKLRALNLGPGKERGRSAVSGKG